MTCEEKIFSEEYLDILVDFPVGDLKDAYPQLDYCQQELEAPYSILYLRKEQVLPLKITNYRYPYIPKCYGLLAEPEREGRLGNGIAYESAGLFRSQLPPLSLSGEGILIGFVDTGIRWQDRAFLGEDGENRVVAVWDQTAQNGDLPEGFLYGSELKGDKLRHDLINERILENGVDRGGINYTGYDIDGHGSRVALAALTGAPRAKIAMVKCRPAKESMKAYYAIDENAMVYAESDIMAGIYYLEKLSRELGLPLIICITMGTNQGDHRGNSLLSRYLNTLSLRARHCVLIGGGNEGNEAHHFAGEISSGEGQIYDEVEIRVGDNVTGFNMELWGNLPANYSVEITAPSGERIPRTNLRYGKEQQFSFLYGQAKLSLAYILSEQTSGLQLLSFTFQRPVSGIWSIRVFAQQGLGTSRFDIWLPMSQFVSGEVYFLRPNPYDTFTEPGFCQEAITFSYYDPTADAFAITSGRGKWNYEGQKPDLCVAGMAVSTPLGIFDGSSASVGVMAGATAQFMQWFLEEDRDLLISTRRLNSLLVRGAIRKIGENYPNPQWGYGQMNLQSVFESLSVI